jgi:hypothetical protein
MKKIKLLVNLPLKLRSKYYVMISSGGATSGLAGAGAFGLIVLSIVLWGIELGLIYLIKPSVFLWAERIFNPTDSKSMGDSLGQPMPFMILLFINVVIVWVDCALFSNKKSRNDGLVC